MAPVLLNPFRFGGGSGIAYSAAVLADTPIIYWRQNDISGTVMTDASGNGRNGVYVGNPTLGVAGATSDGDKAVTYPGGSQYSNVTSGSAADTALKAMAGPFTLEAWANLVTVSGNRGIIDRYGAGGSTESSYLWYMVGNKPTFILRNASNADVTLTATTALTTSTWYHLAATYDGTTMKVYNGGVLDGSQASTFSSHNRSTLLQVARFVYGGGTLSGTLDEVAIYDKALTQSQIAAHVAAA